MSSEEEVKNESKHFDYFLSKIQQVEQRLEKLEGKKDVVNDGNYRNKQHIYLGKLNEKLIKEPKQSTLTYYNVKYDDKEGIYY